MSDSIVSPEVYAPALAQATAVDRPRESATLRSLSAGGLSLLNLVLKFAASLVFIPIALRYLGKQEYGLWIILQSIAGYLALSEIGLGQTVLNLQNVAYARADHAQVNRIMTTAFGLYWMIITPVGLATALIVVTQPVPTWLLKDTPASVAPVFVPYLLLFATLSLVRIPMGVFAATLVGVRELTARQLSESALWLFLLVAPVLTLILHGRVLALILVVNLGLLVLGVLNYPLARWRHPELRLARRFWVSGQLWPLFSNSAFFFLVSLSLLFQRVTGNVLAGRFGSLSQVPEMYVLLAVFRVMGWSLTDILSRTLQPYIIMFTVQGQQDRVRFFARLCTKCSFALAVFFAAGVWMFGEAGLRLWVGKNMFLGYGPLAFLAATFLIDALFLSTVNFMIALNRHRRLSFAMALYAVLTVVCGVAGAKWMPDAPLYGLCIGFFAAAVIAQGSTIPWLARNWLQLSWNEYLQHFLVRPLLLAVLAIAVFVLLWRVGPPAPLARWTGDFSALVLTPIACWFLVFAADERAWISGVLRNSILPCFRHSATGGR